MLTFESPFYEFEGVIVFRDHASPTTFHYLAGPPRLSKTPQGDPNLLLLKYRHALDAAAVAPRLREQLGGGFLLFGVDCGIPEATKNSIRQKLASMAPDDVDLDQVSLVPVLYTRGKVHVLALDKQQGAVDEAQAASPEASRFVRGILGTATPSLLQEQQAIFSLSLTPDAVTLLEEAYQQDLSPIGVMYELEFAGLRPALAVKAHVDMRRLYTQLKADLHVGVRTGGAQGGAAQPTGGTTQPAGGTTRPATGTTQPAAGAGQPAAGAGQPAAGAGQPAAGAGQPAAGAGQPAAGAAAPSEGAAAPAEGATAPAEGAAAPAESAAAPAEGAAAPAEGAAAPAEGEAAPAAGAAPPAGDTARAAGPAPAAATQPGAGAGQPGAGAGQPASGSGQPASGAGQPAAGSGQPAAGAGQPAAGGTTQPAASGGGAAPGTQLALSADLGLVLEEAKQTGAIKIEIIRQQEGATVDQMETRALELLKEVVLKEFFQPGMTGANSQTSAASAAAGAASMASAASGMMATTADTSRGRSGGSGTQVDIGFQLQYKRQEELKEADFDFSVTAPETRTHAPNGFFSALVSGTERDEHIRQIDLDDEFFKVLGVDISTTGDFESIDLKSVVVEMQYGGTVGHPDVTATQQFTPTDQAHKAFTAFLDRGDASYRYRLDYKFGQSEAIAAQHHSYQTPWDTVTSRALVIHPPDDVAILRVRVEPGPVDWDVVDQVETRLAYRDPANGFATDRTVFTRQASEPVDWIVRLSDPARRGYEVRHVWYLKDHSEIAGQPYEEDTPHLFVRDPFDHRLDIRVVPQVDPANVKRIVVELDYEDTRNHHEVRKTIELAGPDFAPQTVTVPVMDPRRREYTYAVTLIKTNGQSENHAPKVTDQESITITEGGIYLDVRVVLLGDLGSVGIDAVQVDLRAEPLDGDRERVEEHLFLPGAETQVTKRLLLRADRPQGFEYRTTAFAADGPRASGWQRHQSAILALQARSLAGGQG